MGTLSHEGGGAGISLREACFIANQSSIRGTSAAGISSPPATRCSKKAPRLLAALCFSLSSALAIPAAALPDPDNRRSWHWRYPWPARCRPPGSRSRRSVERACEGPDTAMAGFARHRRLDVVARLAGCRRPVVTAYAATAHVGMDKDPARPASTCPSSCGWGCALSRSWSSCRIGVASAAC